MHLRSCAVLLAAFVLVFGTQFGHGARRKLNYCGLAQLFECMMEPLWVFTAQYNGTGIPDRETSFENFCL